jgi:hypothetical protein
LPGSNSGIFIHTGYQASGWPEKGYEVQVNQTHTDWRKTGSLYGVNDVKENLAKDDEWYEYHIIVKDKRVIIKINDKLAVDYTEPETLPEDRGKKDLAQVLSHYKVMTPKVSLILKILELRC